MAPKIYFIWPLGDLFGPFVCESWKTFMRIPKISVLAFLYSGMVHTCQSLSLFGKFLNWTQGQRHHVDMSEKYIKIMLSLWQNRKRVILKEMETLQVAMEKQMDIKSFSGLPAIISSKCSNLLPKENGQVRPSQVPLIPCHVSLGTWSSKTQLEARKYCQ